MDSVEKRHLDELASILKQDLDVYGLEVASCCMLNNISYNTLVEMKKRTERFLEAIDGRIRYEEESDD